MKSNKPFLEAHSQAPPSPDWFRSVLGAMTEAVLVNDASGNFLFCNRSAEQLLGLTEAQIIGRTASELIGQAIHENGSGPTPDEYPGMVALRTGQSCRGVILGFRKPNGTLRWVSANAEPLRHDTGPAASTAVTTLLDVTDRRQAELALKQSETLFRTLVENQGEGVGIVDLDERFIFANTAGEAVFGVGSNGLLGRCLLDFVSPAAAEVIRQQTRLRLMAQRGDYELEITRESDGELRTLLVSATPQVDEAGKVTATVGVFRDITDRKRVELALQESEERFRLAIEAGQLGPWEVHPQTGKRIWSQITKKLFGFPPDANVSTEDLLNAVHPDDRERVAAEMRALFSPGHGINSFSEFRILSPEGQERWVASWGRIFFDEQNRPERLIGVTQDITQRKRSEQERELLQAQLTQAQKMESIGRLAGGVAHDFNNLLTVINGYSALALNHLQSQEPVREFVHEICKAGEAAATLVRQLLAFGRKQLLRRQPLDLNVMIGDMKRTLLPLLGEQIEIQTSLRPSLSSVCADKHQIEQVLMNLAINARDAMPDGGVLTIETDEVTCGPYCPQCLSPMHPGRFIRVAVRDTGTGMDEETRQHLFEPFFSTKSASRGSGLGLAMVHGIVLQSDGHIDVISRVGEGTCFDIYLPAAEKAQLNSASSETAASTGHSMHGSETILLVEDKPEVRRFTASLLQECGYTVLQSGSAEEALEQFGLQEVDLLITDVVLPKMSGCELAAAARLRHPGLRVMFVSGYSDEMLEGHADAIRGAVLVQKPFVPPAFAAKVREVLGGSLSH